MLWGKCNNSGQICVAPDYVLCSKVRFTANRNNFKEQIVKEVQEKIIPIMKKMLINFYSETPELSPDYCRIVSARHFSRLSSMLSSTQGSIVVGGSSSESSRFMELTVITGVGWDDSTMQAIEDRHYSNIC